MILLQKSLALYIPYIVNESHPHKLIYLVVNAGSYINCGHTNVYIKTERLLRV